MCTPKQKFLIDTDCGIDDTQCILTALHYLDIKGIVTVAGNVSEKQGAVNCAKILEFCGKEAPIFYGCDEPLIEPKAEIPCIHGRDGMGDAEEAQTVKGYTHCINEEEHGSAAIARLAKEHAGDLSIICIGPLTNLAVALKIDPKLPEKLKSVWVMGGTYRGIGNVTLSTEYNFRQDPEAARMVLKKFNDVKIIPWELALDTEPKEEKHLNKLFDTSTSLGLFHYQSQHFFYQRAKRWFFTDGLVGVCTADPTAIEASFKAYGTVDCSGGMSKGSLQLFGPESGAHQIGVMQSQFGIDVTRQNVEVITKVNLEKCIEVIATAISEQSRARDSISTGSSNGDEEIRQKSGSLNEESINSSPEQLTELTTVD